jgi:LysM repeat protein
LLILIFLPFFLAFAQDSSLFDLSLYQTENSVQVSEAPALIEEDGIVKEITKIEIPEKTPQETSQNTPLPKFLNYTIQPGDTLSSIAQRFGLKLSTLLWTNDLNLNSILKPGEEILVPSKDGLLHRVKKGETLSEIAQKYKAQIEEIIEFNGLKNDLIVEGDELFIPGGTPPPPPPPPKPKRNQVTTLATSTPQVKAYPGGNCRTFPYGYCTYYVSTKRCIPWSGHAKFWLNNAKAYGFNVCYGSNCEPAPGAILVTTGDRRYGHVAYIEEVNGNKMVISEMNVVGWGKVSTRVIFRGDPSIRGIIY